MRNLASRPSTVRLNTTNRVQMLNYGISIWTNDR
jgi:hypothetical protein